MSKKQVDEMIERQRTFFFSGATKSIEYRKQQLQTLKKAIKQHEQEILSALKYDLNKSEFEAYTTEIGIIYDSINLFIKNIDEWAKQVAVKTPIHFQPAKSFTMREPYGVVLIIAPFNYPFQLVMEPLIGALIAGNTAIIKPSEDTVHTTNVIRKIIEATFDERYVKVIEGGKEVVTTLVHAPFDHIFFTGSVATGKVVMKAAAERLIPVTLELGGKSPAIVDQTANLSVAAKRIAWGKFSNNGQTCVTVDYALVHVSIYKKFVRLLQQAIIEFYGKDVQQSKDYGRIVGERHFGRLEALLNAEREQITFGGKTDREDLYIEPTIIEGAGWDSAIMAEEIFGPILPIMAYHELPNALQAVRQLPKPLAAYLFSENDHAVQYFLDEFSFGGGCINDITVHVGNPNLPFGGIGTSGIGSYHGKASFDCFTHEKSIMHRSTKMANSMLFPPYNKKVKLVRSLLK